MFFIYHSMRVFMFSGVTKISPLIMSIVTRDCNWTRYVINNDEQVETGKKEQASCTNIYILQGGNCGCLFHSIFNDNISLSDVLWKITILTSRHHGCHIILHAYTFLSRWLRWQLPPSAADWFSKLWHFHFMLKSLRYHHYQNILCFVSLFGSPSPD